MRGFATYLVIYYSKYRVYGVLDSWLEKMQFEDVTLDAGKFL